MQHPNHARPDPHRGCAGGGRADWLGIELRVRQGSVLEHDRRRFGCPLDLRLEQLVHAARPGIARPRRVPAAQELGSLGPGEDRQIGKPRGQASSTMLSSRSRNAQPSAPRWRNRTGRRRTRALPAQSHRPAPRRSGSGRTSRSRLEVPADELETRQVERRRGRVLQREHDLEQRECGSCRAPAAAPRPASRRAGPDGRRPPASPPSYAPAVAETSGRPTVRAQHQRVDEEADQPLDLRSVAVGDRRADGEVSLSGVAVQQHLEGREQRHEQGGTPPRGQRAQAPVDGSRDGERMTCPAIALHRRPRPIRRQVEHLGQAVQLLAPVGELLAPAPRPEPLALPARRSPRTGWPAAAAETARPPRTPRTGPPAPRRRCPSTSRRRRCDAC